MEAPPGLVLVVEDDSDLRDGLVALLGDEGWSAAGAKDGLDAKQKLEAGLAPCAVLLDLMMPRMSGHEFLAWLRGSAEPLNELPVMVMTAHWSRDVPGADRVLHKPLAANDVLEELKRLCAR